MTCKSATLVMDVPPRPDYPNGYAARYHRFLDALASDFRLRIIAVEPVLKPQGLTLGPADFVPPGVRVAQVHWVGAGNNPLNVPGLQGVVRRLRHYLSARRPYMSYPPSLAAFDIPSDYLDPDLFIVFLPSLAHLALELTRAPVIAVLEDSWERSLLWNEASINPLWRRFVTKGEMRRMKNLRRALDARISQVIVLANRELEAFSDDFKRTPIEVLPHGIDVTFFRPEQAAREDIDLLVVGRMTGLLLDASIKLLRALDPLEVPPRMAFIGEGAEASLGSLRSEVVTVVGDVEDVRPWYARSKVVLAPAGFGAPDHYKVGARTTVLQGWAMGKAVVATPFVLDGIPAAPGRNVLVADSPVEMLRQASLLLKDDFARTELAVEGLRTAREERDIQRIAERFRDVAVNVAGMQTR